MPIYEYQCQACKKRYELQQSFSAETTHTCEKCGKGTAKRILHAPRVVFKGSGFYATDSRRGTAAVEDSGSSDNGSKSKESKTTSKSETKASTSKSSDGAAEAAV